MVGFEAPWPDNRTRAIYRGLSALTQVERC
jgi:hypothetical protein